MSESLTALANVGIIAFVLASTVSLGLSLTMKQIIEPLTNDRMVVSPLVTPGR